MSGTEGYYFGKKWVGIEKIGKIIEKKPTQDFRSSHALSIGEEIAILVDVIEKIIDLQSDIRESLDKFDLSERDVYTEMTNLEDRIEWAINKFQEASNEIRGIKTDLLAKKNLDD